MLRSGFILGVSAPAALLTILVQPVIRDTADHWSPPKVASMVPVSLPGTRPASVAINPTRTAALRNDSRSTPLVEEAQEMGVRPALQPRRTVREGCETALSSLVGPEARRMTPGRCIS